MDVNPTALYETLQKDLVRVLGPAAHESCETLDLRALDRDCDQRLVASVQLSRAFVKKFEPVNRSRILAERAINSFLASNDTCANWSKTDMVLLNTMRFFAYRELPPLDWATLLSDLKPGPGASVGSLGRNSAFEKLFTNKLTCTSQALYGEYREFLKTCSPEHELAERARRCIVGTACDVVSGSKLSTVAKNSETDRTVCTEPSLNMLFQSALGAAFERTLMSRYGYDKARQPGRNSELARRGSITGTTSTIDLKNASDMTALALCQFVLPSDWFAAVIDCRSPVTRLPDGTDITLNMVSSMGNGFTFHLMTYMFSLMLKSICSISGSVFTKFDRDGTDFGVFGDDIIVPSDLYDVTLKALTDLGYIPNVDKSFKDGAFRESCGTDWFNGYAVRGVYVKQLRSLQDRFSLINRLNRWSARHGIPLPCTIRMLLPRDWERYQVPPDEADVAGVHIPFSLRRGNKVVYTRFAPKQRKFRILFEKRQHFRKGWDNPFGFLLCASVSWVDSLGLERRSRRAEYVLERAFTPGWDEGFSRRIYSVPSVSFSRSGLDSELAPYRGLSVIRRRGPEDDSLTTSQFIRWEGFTIVNLTN